jgi:hypothetical protein
MARHWFCVKNKDVLLMINILDINMKEWDNYGVYDGKMVKLDSLKIYQLAWYRITTWFHIGHDKDGDVVLGLFNLAVDKFVKSCQTIDRKYVINSVEWTKISVVACLISGPSDEKVLTAFAENYCA